MKIDTANGPVKIGLPICDDFSQEVADRFEQIKKRCFQHTEDGSPCDCPCCFLLSKIHSKKHMHLFNNVMIKFRSLPDGECAGIYSFFRTTELGLAAITIDGYAIIPIEEYNALTADKEAKAHDTLSRSTD